jgi:hypothetical protein
VFGFKTAFWPLDTVEPLLGKIAGYNNELGAAYDNVQQLVLINGFIAKDIRNALRPIGTDRLKSRIFSIKVNNPALKYGASTLRSLRHPRNYWF